MISLVPVSRDREAAFIEMREDWRGDAYDPFGVFFAVAWTDFPAYVDVVEQLRDGRGPLPGLVPMDSFWIEEDGSLLGSLSIRYELTPQLMNRGGNIGYSVRPSARNRGVATQALRLALTQLHERGIYEALVTCADWNVRSARVIEKCGGRRIENATLDDGTIERRYWVPTGSAQ